MQIISIYLGLEVLVINQQLMIKEICDKLREMVWWILIQHNNQIELSPRSVPNGSNSTEMRTAHTFSKSSTDVCEHHYEKIDFNCVIGISNQPWSKLNSDHKTEFGVNTYIFA